MHLEMELDMSRARLGFEVITKLRNYTGFSPIELLIVVAVMVCWPQRRSAILDLPDMKLEQR
jgi:hypothetical protein